MPMFDIVQLMCQTVRIVNYTNGEIWSVDAHEISRHMTLGIW